VLDDNTFATMVQELEAQGLVERHLGLADKRTGQPRQTFTLTTKGQQSAMEILAASLTRNS
jgi:DNA-binding MarR family transcriptional regulator